MQHILRRLITIFYHCTFPLFEKQQIIIVASEKEKAGTWKGYYMYYILTGSLVLVAPFKHKTCHEKNAFAAVWK